MCADAEGGQPAQRVPKIHESVFALGPALYVAADLVEDVLLARMLLSTEPVGQHTIDLARIITRVKFAACGYGILQTAVLTGIAALIAS